MKNSLEGCEEKLLCDYCGTPLINQINFCSKCGNRIVPIDTGHRLEIKKFLGAFFAILVYLLSLYLLEIKGDYVNVIIISGIFLFGVIILSFIFLNEVKPYIGIRALKLQKLVKYLAIQIVITVFVFLMAHFLNGSLGLKGSSMFAIFKGAPYPLMMAIISVAIFPAITEEIGFRAVLFGQLEKLTSGLSAVIVTGLLFALVHFSFLSFIWLIPSGIFLGWVRLKERTIWYGVVCHFTHNLIVVVIAYQDFYN